MDEHGMFIREGNVRKASGYRTLFSRSIQYELLERSFRICNSSVEFQFNYYLAHISNM
jgi:hypothetical protein